MAKELGIDYENGEKINFDFCSPEFVENYFKYTHHGNEEKGVSFWWVDGFPENTGKLQKANIPWMLNHYHYVDNTRNGNRGMLFSRNCGVGGHRYGIGFSGDTYSTWEMLDFLPYFTSTASNVGFCWWSHDVGGFMGGTRDDEMMVRWEQFSVFSPINRLHCVNNPFMSKEPWNFNEVAEKVISDFMRLRHKLIPYIYTMNYRCWNDNITLIRPLYYYCKERRDRKNEYFFGDDLLISPITSKMDNVTNMGHAFTYLPEGIWFDYFSSRKYIGDRDYNVYRDIYTIPVFAKAGSIIPHAVLNTKNYISNPEELKIDVFPGDSNSFEMYEDDGVSLKYKDGECCKTKFEIKWSEYPEFIINKPVGNLKLIPENRKYNICFRKINNIENIQVTSNSKPVDFVKSYDGTNLTISVSDVYDTLTVKFLDTTKILDNNLSDELDAFLLKMQISNDKKMKLSALAKREDGVNAMLNEVCCDDYDENFKNAFTEFVACGQ